MPVAIAGARPEEVVVLRQRQGRGGDLAHVPGDLPEGLEGLAADDLSEAIVEGAAQRLDSAASSPRSCSS
jgi:hypothetical protein